MRKNLIIVLLILMTCNQLVTPRFEFTNIECIVTDPEFVAFRYCYLKSINRTYKYLSLRATLLQGVITDCVVQFALFKKANGYRPFLYNITFDGCKFLAARKKDPLKLFFYNFFSSHSNINHTCPYSGDMVVEKLTTDTLDNILTHNIPFPRGDFLFHTSWRSYQKERGRVLVNVKIF